jgi:hypothetical protein
LAYQPDACRGQTVSDKAPAEKLDPDGSLGWNDGGSCQGLSRALFHVAAFEVEHGRPVGLVALVINGTGSYDWFPAVAGCSTGDRYSQGTAGPGAHAQPHMQKALSLFDKWPLALVAGAGFEPATSGL